MGVSSDLRAAQWDLRETIGVAVPASVTATSDTGPVSWPSTTAFRVFAPTSDTDPEPITNSVVVVGNVVSGSIITAAQSAQVGLGSVRWALLDTTTKDEYISGRLILSEPGVPATSDRGPTDLSVTIGVNEVTLTGVIVPDGDSIATLGAELDAHVESTDPHPNIVSTTDHAAWLTAQLT